MIPLLVEAGHVPFAERFVPHHGGVVDQPVDLAVVIQAGRRDVLGAGGIGQVGGQAQRITARGPDLPGHFLQGVRAPADQDDAGAGGAKLAGRRRTDAAARSGHDDDGPR